MTNSIPEFILLYKLLAICLEFKKNPMYFCLFHFVLYLLFKHNECSSLFWHRPRYSLGGMHHLILDWIRTWPVFQTQNVFGFWDLCSGIILILYKQWNMSKMLKLWGSTWGNWAKSHARNNIVDWNWILNIFFCCGYNFMIKFNSWVWY